jgi:hypothetical protein
MKSACTVFRLVLPWSAEADGLTANARICHFRGVGPQLKPAAPSPNDPIAMKRECHSTRAVPGTWFHFCHRRCYASDPVTKDLVEGTYRFFADGARLPAPPSRGTAEIRLAGSIETLMGMAAHLVNGKQRRVHSRRPRVRLTGPSSPIYRPDSLIREET